MAEAIEILHRQFPENTDLTLMKFRLRDIERGYTIQKVLERAEYERNRNPIAAALLAFLDDNAF